METQNISELSQIVGVFISFIGLYGIWYQLKKQKETILSQFIVDLNNSFIENEGLKKVYHKLRNPEVHGYLSVDDRDFIVDYLTFFETLCILHDKKTLDMSTINEMFAFRFFKAVNNDLIQEIELEENGIFYTSLYKLYAEWEKFRIAKGLEIIDDENSLLKFATIKNFY